MTTYKFITKHNQHELSPSIPDISFYQISLHPHPKTKLHNIRKFKIDNDDNITSMSEHNITKLQYEQIIKQKKPHEYKQYSVYNLKNVTYPQRGDILLLKSNILSVNNNYSGFAPF